MITFLRTLFLLAILITLIVGMSGYFLYEHKLQAPFPLINDVPYTVAAGSNLSQVAMDLMNQELLDYPSALTWVTLARYQQKAHLIKSGNYVITSGMTPQGFLDALVKGKTSPLKTPR